MTDMGLKNTEPVHASVTELPTIAEREERLRQQWRVEQAKIAAEDRANWAAEDAADFAAFQPTRIGRALDPHGAGLANPARAAAVMARLAEIIEDDVQEAIDVAAARAALPRFVQLVPATPELVQSWRAEAGPAGTVERRVLAFGLDAQGLVHAVTDDMVQGRNGVQDDASWLRDRSAGPDSDGLYEFSADAPQLMVVR
jgi:hypothetical protein